MSSLILQEEDIWRRPLFLRAFCVFLGSWLVFILTAATLFSLTARVEIALISSSIATIVYSYLILGSTRILRWLCKRWTLKRFLKLEKFANYFVLFGIVGLYSSALLGYVVDLPPLVIVEFSVLLIGLSLSMCYTNVFRDADRPILYLKQFLEDRKKKRADFDLLLLASKKITKWLEDYNLKVSPYSLCLGMSRVSLGEESEGDLGKIVNGLENPNNSESFSALLSSVEAFMSIAKKSKDRGIHEPTGLLSERVFEILRYIAIPILVAFMAYIIPKILEMLRP